MSQQKLVYAIIEFLNQSLEDGTVKQDDKEGLEVAIQCIGEAFGVHLSDKEQSERLSIKPTTLESVFDLFLKTRDKVASASAPPKPSSPTTHDKTKAEEFKKKGNEHMSNKRYEEAIELYTQAIELDPTNSVYYANRAAAYSSKEDHTSAIGDAEDAIGADPSYVKAYHRLGHAHYSLGNYKEAAESFQRGLDVEPGNPSLTSALANARAKQESEPPSDTQSTRSTQPGTELGEFADMLQDGGSGGGGGNFDLAAMMKNPMMMQMAQKMMAGGGMDGLMENPAVQNMMNRMQSGGSLPSMTELMSDPELKKLAKEIGTSGASNGR